jgi:hypothetical protein
MAELITTFVDTGATLKNGTKAVATAAENFVPRIATDLRVLIERKMVDPFIALVDGDIWNCSFLSAAWISFLEGTCYTFGGAIAAFANIYTVCASCAFLLIFLLFGLWRHFIDMYQEAEKNGINVTREQIVRAATGVIVPSPDD